MIRTLLAQLLPALLLLATAPQCFAYELDSIVAVVNEDVIVRSELEREITRIMAQIQERGTRLPPSSVIERQVLERMINNRLQLQAADRAGVKLDDATLARAIGNIAEKNGLTLTELRDTLKAEGMDFNSFREDTRERIILARLRTQQVINRITVTDREVANFIAHNLGKLTERSDVHLQHILISTPEDVSPEEVQRAKEKAQQLVDKLRAGADFAETALVYSDGRQALEGGDLGWMKLSQVPSIAVEAARTLMRGEITDPTRSSSGYHIFAVLDYKGSDRQLITQTHARHILIKTNELVSDDDARTRLQQLRFRLLGGDDFDSIARSHSQDTGSAAKGGDLGWVSPGDTVPSFEQQMNNLAPGEFSQPFQSPFGWHLMQVIERREFDNSEAMLKSKARDSVRERKAEEATELWLRRLRDEAYVEMRLPDADETDY